MSSFSQEKITKLLKVQDKEHIEEIVDRNSIRILKESCYAERNHVKQLRNRVSWLHTEQQKKKILDEAKIFETTQMRACDQLYAMGYN